MKLIYNNYLIMNNLIIILRNEHFVDTFTFWKNTNSKVNPPNEI